MPHLETLIQEATQQRKFFLRLLAYEEDAKAEDYFIAWDREFERLTNLREMLQ